MDWIDLRSDTVTKPDAEMRRAMAEAEVGDDVFGEDPTVLRLEEEAAAAVGMEAALFVPSGTMGNQIALHLHGRRGGEVICDTMAHILHYRDRRHGGAFGPAAAGHSVAWGPARSRRRSRPPSSPTSPTRPGRF